MPSLFYACRFYQPGFNGITARIYIVGVVCMVAVVIRDASLKKHRVEKHFCENICTVLVGRAVGKRRIEKTVSRFGGDYLLYGIDSTGLFPFSAEKYKRKLLFKQFFNTVSSGTEKQNSIGIVDIKGEFFRHLPAVQENCRMLLVVTEADTGGIEERCMRTVGAAPEFFKTVTPLLDCNTVFAPDGLAGYGGVLFGKGGTDAFVDPSALPVYCRKPLEAGADPTELAALLCADEPSLII